MGRLDGKVALISGGARGQGAREAEIFVAEGAKVIIGDVLDDEGEAVARGLGEACTYLHLDVADEEQWIMAVKETEHRYGALNVLINNAGIGTGAAFEEFPLADYRRIVMINEIGPFLGTKHSIAPMRRAGGGSIINISSVYGLAAQPGVAGYTATKFALRGFTKTAALELGVDNIRVNSVHPGGIDTPMLRAGGRMDAPSVGAMFARVPLNRLGTVDDIAMLAIYLASDESAYCTGAEFVIDGGWSAGPMPGALGSEK